MERTRIQIGNFKLLPKPGETLLEVLERHGLRPEHQCRDGLCGACQIACDNPDSAAVRPDALAHVAEGKVLACVSQVADGETLVVTERSLAVQLGQVVAALKARRRQGEEPEP